MRVYVLIFNSGDGNETVVPVAIFDSAALAEAAQRSVENLWVRANTEIYEYEVNGANLGETDASKENCAAAHSAYLEEYHRRCEAAGMYLKKKK